MKFDGAAFKNLEGLNVGILKFFPIKIADNDEVNYSPPVNTLSLAKSELPSPPQVDPNIPSAPPQHTLCHSTRVCCPPEYLQDYLFTTVADKQHQPPPPPYHTARWN